MKLMQNMETEQTERSMNSSSGKEIDNVRNLKMKEKRRGNNYIEKGRCNNTDLDTTLNSSYPIEINLNTHLNLML